MSLEVLYADNHLLVACKPACQPTVPDESGDESLFDRARRWIEIEHRKPGRAFLGVVHRLDRPVSGVVVFARTSKAAARLTEQFRGRRVRKTYLAVCAGAPRADGGEATAAGAAGAPATLEQWLVKDREMNRVRALDGPAEGAKRAVTRWRVLASRGRETLVELAPETGRPHQLRVALASLGAPILGDLKYGADRALPDRSIALHASRLELFHPTTRDERVFACPPPDTDWWRLATRRS